MTESTTKSRLPKVAAWGCLASVVLLIALPAAGWWSWGVAADRARIAAETEQAARAEEAFGPAKERLEASKAPVIDIDRTVQVIHSVDLAMQDQEDMESFLRVMAAQDYTGVAPEVLEARKQLLDILQPLYAKQVELEDQEALWEMTSELMLATLSVVSVSGEVDMAAPSGQFAVDREQARELWRDLKERKADRAQLQRDVTALEKDLLDVLMDYSEVYYRYLKEWDQLCVLRDRSYLAVHNQDWAAARASAELAVQQAPTEREAHLLLALSMLEGGHVEEQQAVAELLEDYIHDNPERSAPAFLLMGVLHAKAGRTKEATLAFQQSAAYYPKQSDQLLDMLDPYKMRDFLNASREGSFIVEEYKSTMLGAGYFSPDLQMAKMLFDEGDFAAGRTKVLDHFARRRNQKQWDFIISDIQFCQDLLGPDFWQIFPEDTYLDLEASATMLGSGLNLSINNRSARTLRNATLVLALHLTDMYPDMYVAVPAQATVPAVPAHEVTSFGSVDIELTYGGQTKLVSDIVEHRAILVTDDAVLWVDTDEYKIAKVESVDEEKRAANLGKSAHAVEPARHPEFMDTRDAIIAGLSQGIDVEIEQKYGSDNVLIELPRELSILRPIFRLRYGDQVFHASDNLIEGDSITLRFSGVENFDGLEQAEDLELVMASPFGDIVLTWNQNGELTWDYAGVQPAEGK